MPEEQAGETSTLTQGGTTTTLAEGASITEQDAPKTQEETPQAEGTDVAEESTLLGEGESQEGEKPVVPDTYEFKLPEGMEVDNAMVDAITPVFKDIGITQEQAQKLVDVYAPQMKATMEATQNAISEEYKKTVDEWKAETIKQLGADADKQLAVAAKFIDKFGGSELREFLNDTGVGNNPIMVKMMINAGKAISEDSFVDSKATKVETGGLDPSKLYPTMKK